ncbi:hypothetical protein LTR85_005415 [Meristemomyces frigidus]|nr:hypothetical protein LTR85_005415 [Meristemomyces frigidus]
MALADGEEPLDLVTLLELQQKPRLQDQLRKDKHADKALTQMQQLVQSSKSHRVKDIDYVEGNWDCKLVDSLPAALKPRMAGYKGKRVGHTQPDKKRLPPGEWTKAFIRALAHLSKITQGDQPFAHKKLFEQVKSRQRKCAHPEYYAREALTSDLDAVTAKIQRLIGVGRYVRPMRNQGHTGGRRLDDADVQTTEGDVVNLETRQAEVAKILAELSEEHSTAAGSSEVKSGAGVSQEDGRSGGVAL